MLFTKSSEREKRSHLGTAMRAAMMLFLSIFLSAMSANAQNAVKGTVTDEAGEPLIGASVVIPGTTVGTTTDIDGNFSIAVAQGKKIRITYVGYLSQDVTVKGNDLKIVLKEDNELLEEVVVIGYGTMKKKDLTGSITTVNSKDLNVGSYTDPGQLLQGKVPGLVVVQNSDPNGGVNSLTLRGASTLNGSTSPLYVHKLLVRFCHLWSCHAVFGISRIIHNCIRNCEFSTRIEAAGDSFWNTGRFF